MSSPSTAWCRLRVGAAVLLASLVLVPRSGICAGHDLLPTEGASEAVPAAQITATRWYGYQVMLADVASLGLLAMGQPKSFAQTPNVLTTAGLASFFLAPAVVHAMNGRPWLAVASPLLRVGLPVTVGLLWYAAFSCRVESNFCGLDAIVLGGGLGLSTALVLDYVLARTPAAASSGPDAKPRSMKRSRWIELRAAAVAPVDGGGAKLLLGGAF
jgi:hypothetical protein